MAEDRAPGMTPGCDPSRNPADAERFFASLGIVGSLTFQTFDDGPAKNKRLARIVHGTFAQREEQLRELNAQGAGIFFMANEGDLMGRRALNVMRVRALFLDLDSVPLEPVLAAGARAHAVVESSPGRYQIWWRVEGCSLSDFTAAQKALAARFGGDAKVCDLPRVMRIPGFYHRKGAPYRSRVQSVWAGPEYSLGNLLDKLGVQWHSKPLTEVGRKSSSVSLPCSSVSLLSAVEATTPQNGGVRNDRLFEFARRFKALQPDAGREARRAAVAVWHEAALPFIRTEDFAVTLEDFERAWSKVKTPHGAIIDAILQQAQSAPLPEGIDRLGYGRASNLLVRICATMQGHQEGEHRGNTLILPCRQVAEWVGVDHTTASKMLHTLAADGVIALVSQGGRVLEQLPGGRKRLIGKASRYQYVWQAQRRGTTTSTPTASSAELEAA